MEEREHTTNETTGLLARWFSPAGYLGTHLAVGFLLALAAGLLFDFIEDAVFEAPATLAMDAWAQRVASAMASPTLTSAMRLASWVGNPPTIAFMSVAVGVGLVLKRSHRRLAAFAATMAGGSLLNVLLKGYYQRARPSEIVPLATAHGFSFPSGHSMGSMLFFGGLAYVIYFSIEAGKGGRARRRAAVALCALTVVIIGLSRVYLGVHYLSDVLAGFTAGLGWICVCLSGVEAWVRLRDWIRSRRANRDARGGRASRMA